jgi:hypothetical protein
MLAEDRIVDSEVDRPATALGSYKFDQLFDAVIDYGDSGQSEAEQGYCGYCQDEN